MFKCKSCNADIHFDVASQQMLCDYCGQSYDPYEFDSAKGATESTDFDVTIFTCPSCGAELGSVETSAAEFCSFCGSSVVLESRMSKMSRPKYIIPFKKTKEECAASLSEHLKSSFFVPSDFRSSEVESFRGIYMPYWNYKVTQKGKVTLHATKFSHSKGDYDYYDNYRISAHVDASYDGIPHDASYDFADSISESLEPYDYKNRKNFTPGYISGFFADVKDVEAKNYQEDAEALANRRTYDTILSQVEFSESDMKEKVTDKNISRILKTEPEDTDCTLVPVWFLAYRKNNRVAYAAVNGETGKVVSDMPIDMKKVYAMIPILAIPLFLILNLFLSIRASHLMLFAAATIGIASVFYLAELFMIKENEKTIYTDRASRKSSKKMKKNIQDENRVKKKGFFKNALSNIWGTILGLIGIACFLAVFSEMIGFSALLLLTIPYLCAVLIPIWGIVDSLKGERKDDPNYGVKDTVGFAVLLVAALIDLIVYFVKPVSDLYYYGGGIVSFVAILIVILRFIQMYNAFTTRPLPQFTRRGGADHE